MALNGSDLYAKIKPIIKAQESNPDPSLFFTKVAAAISTYVTSNDEHTGTYAGIIPGPTPTPSPLVAAIGASLPVSATLPSPNPGEKWDGWLKRALGTTLTWELSPTAIHTFTAVPLNPLTTPIDTLGNLKDLRSAYGIWALISDIIVVCVLSAPERILPVSATATDGSSGTIVWIPTDIPTVTHNFLFKVQYDASNAALVQWLRSHRVDTSHASGTIPIPLDDKAYQAAVVVWNGLKAITKDCEFYKVQDSGEEIFLVNGFQL